MSRIWKVRLQVTEKASQVAILSTTTTMRTRENKSLEQVSDSLSKESVMTDGNVAHIGRNVLLDVD